MLVSLLKASEVFYSLTVTKYIIIPALKLCVLYFVHNFLRIIYVLKTPNILMDKAFIFKLDEEAFRCAFLRSFAGRCGTIFAIDYENKRNTENESAEVLAHLMSKYAQYIL